MEKNHADISVEKPLRNCRSKVHWSKYSSKNPQKYDQKKVLGRSPAKIWRKFYRRTWRIAGEIAEWVIFSKCHKEFLAIFLKEPVEEYLNEFYRTLLKEFPEEFPKNIWWNSWRNSLQILCTNFWSNSWRNSWRSPWKHLWRNLKRICWAKLLVDFLGTCLICFRGNSESFLNEFLEEFRKQFLAIFPKEFLEESLNEF